MGINRIRNARFVLGDAHTYTLRGNDGGGDCRPSASVLSLQACWTVPNIQITIHGDQYPVIAGKNMGQGNLNRETGDRFIFYRSPAVRVLSGYATIT